MAKQTRQAVAEADAVIFVVDMRGGLSAKTTTSPLPAHRGQNGVLAANKAEGMVESPALLGEFFELGMGEPHPISSAHGQGIRSLEAAWRRFAFDEEDDADVDVEASPSGWPWPAGPMSARAR
jgi:GTPase